MGLQIIKLLLLLTYKTKYMKYFSITLCFDYGKFVIITSASDEQAAINKVMNSENCPRCAITHISEHSGAGYFIA